ncbi:creatinine amidohydrolase [Thermoanaerobacterium thermosaccharolyticum]|uniref:Creatinine amidohydrolase n=1 Tax=Thermoanaerobacterium thermosaccharolyticum TaxID=1517 RepID=A0A231VLU2_THETR|nr:creatininase family protein [Thermoanaerobacterium thermosaccharolyticum]OXT09235.1 creatinine amidohydrolase [Thermoanaerobacterium thermosaccharolyticum]
MINQFKEMSKMTRDEIAQYVKEFPVAVLPIGSTEQHGPHLPLGTDTIIATEISKIICNRTGAILLPTLSFGYSWVWRDIPGTVSLEQDHLEIVIKDIAHSLSRYGIKLLVIVNGHDANNASMKYATRELMDEIKMNVIYLFYTDDLEKIIKEYCQSETWYGMFHACEFETSLMLALRPDLVDMNKAVKEYPLKPLLYGKSTISLENLSESGVYGDPTIASEEKGNNMLKVIVEKMVNYVYEACKDIIGK